MRVRIEKLIKHLKTQIAVSDGMGADFCYITKNEAKKCLELAEAEDTLYMTPVKADSVETEAEIEGGGSSWWYVCSECRITLAPSDHYCRNCGRKIVW